MKDEIPINRKEIIKKWSLYGIYCVLLLGAIIYLLIYFIEMLPQYTTEAICKDYEPEIIKGSYIICIFIGFLPFLWCLFEFFECIKKKPIIELLLLIFLIVGLLMSLYCLVFVCLYPHSTQSMFEMNDQKRIGIEEKVCFLVSLSIFKIEYNSLIYKSKY